MAEKKNKTMTGQQSTIGYSHTQNEGHRVVLATNHMQAHHRKVPPGTETSYWAA